MVSTGVRLFALLAALSLCVAACGQSPSSAPSTATTASSASVNPARIERVRTELPSGYEVAALSGRAAPVAFWGLGPGLDRRPAAVRRARRSCRRRGDDAGLVGFGRRRDRLRGGRGLEPRRSIRH